MSQLVDQGTLTKKDFASKQDVRWCPGCGDYSILSSVQSVMPEIGVPKEKIVFVSGIGCSSRFPHYMSTYGFHSIHGRAPSVATGLKLANPDLSVWVVTGDGDGLSIGGNHLIHCIRRNIDLKILLFNNKIYGLTKGQYSPTSDVGTKAKSTPYGSIDRAFNAISVAIGSQATFVARTIDTDPKHMQEIFKRAAEHKGTAFVEILQNCVIFNDKVHSPITSPENKIANQLRLEHGKPMLFGKDNKNGVRLNPNTLDLEIVEVGSNGITEQNILVHDEKRINPTIHFLTGELDTPAALGVIRNVEGPNFEEEVYKQITKVKELKGEGNLEKLLNSGETWTIE
ncbi:MAG: 2-oxoacid:ferredoxin oxidoreductase subunit beta [Candidatus Caenarcaniphilales bacterium]|nr:2-oxoacid:ferredoxin oxidoreductase subunit beta [Candidatus Caenarcaniphilales bacterium]